MGNSSGKKRSGSKKNVNQNAAAEAGKDVFVKTMSNEEDLANRMQKVTINEDKSKKKTKKKDGYKLKLAKPVTKSPNAQKERTVSSEKDEGQNVAAPQAAYPCKKWTPDQDEALRKAVELHEGKNWKAIAEAVPGRTHVQCLQRWKKVLQPGLIKGHWTEEEDQLLISLVTQPGANLTSWVAIAQHVPGRTAKQCRERWSLNLDPSIKKTEWEPEEDEQLLQLHAQLGNKWAQISQQMEGRTENAVKTRYKSLIRKQQKEWTSVEDQIVVDSKRYCNYRWVSIANKLPGRSKNAVKLRWKHLVSENPSLEDPIPKDQKDQLQKEAEDRLKLIEEQQQREKRLEKQLEAIAEQPIDTDSYMKVKSEYGQQQQQHQQQQQNVYPYGYENVVPDPVSGQGINAWLNQQQQQLMEHGYHHPNASNGYEVGNEQAYYQYQQQYGSNNNNNTYMNQQQDYQRGQDKRASSVDSALDLLAGTVVLDNNDDFTSDALDNSNLTSSPQQTYSMANQFAHYELYGQTPPNQYHNNHHQQQQQQQQYNGYEYQQQQQGLYPPNPVVPQGNVFDTHLDPSKTTFERVPSKLKPTDSVSRQVVEDDRNLYKPLEKQGSQGTNLQTFTSTDNMILIDALNFGGGNGGSFRNHNNLSDTGVV